MITIVSFRVPENATNFLTSWITVRFSRRTLLHGVKHYHWSL